MLAAGPSKQCRKPGGLEPRAGQQGWILRPGGGRQCTLQVKDWKCCSQACQKLCLKVLENRQPLGNQPFLACFLNILDDQIISLISLMFSVIFLFSLMLIGISF